MAQRKSSSAGRPAIRTGYLDGPAAKPPQQSRLVSGDGPITEGGKGDARRLEPTVTEWNDHSNEAPPSDLGPTPEEARAMLQAADGGMPTTVTSRSREDGDKAQKIRDLLGRKDEPTEGEAPAEGETETPADETTEAATETPPAETPSRRDRLSGIDAKVESERRRLAAERELQSEREKRKALEATLSGTDVLAFARSRGMTKDQAIDALLNANETAAAAGNAAPDPMKAINDRLANLEAREREVTKREGMAIVERMTTDLDIPVARASKRVNVQNEDGTSEVMSGMELIAATARRLWERDGSPEGGIATYLKEAAPLVEQQLIADQKEVLEAYVAKRSAGKPNAPTKKPPAPAIGRRTNAGGGPSSAQAAPKLSEDYDERQKQIKARFGWT